MFERITNFIKSKEPLDVARKMGLTCLLSSFAGIMIAADASTRGDHTSATAGMLLTANGLAGGVAESLNILNISCKQTLKNNSQLEPGEVLVV